MVAAGRKVPAFESAVPLPDVVHLVVSKKRLGLAGLIFHNIQSFPPDVFSTVCQWQTPVSRGMLKHLYGSCEGVVRLNDQLL